MEATFTIFFCGDTPEIAISGLAWDGLDGAQHYAIDNDTNIYSVEVKVSQDQLKECVE